MSATARHRLTDRHVLVTGAGTGIGRAIALRLGAEGARLTLAARTVERLDEVAQQILTAGGHLPGTAALDIRDRAAVDAAFAAAAAERGPLYALVANAGIGGANEPGPDDRFDDLVATNLTGTYSCCRAAQRHLAEGPGARHLVLIASILGRIGVAGYTGYCASKTALTGLARALAMELAANEVQVNAVCPGWVDTAMAREGIDGIAAAVGCTHEEAYAMAMRDVPLGRMSEPEDVAGMVAWLLSSDARGVTGQALDMNGGAFML
ncbi:SDR family NAD(P)-dependent oxidoreductase [Engelhardtia mirabilis]|uniref:Ketoacyl reductase n=1 Tax=Engelhardtia mirabilis TaxID=2528011 RepID=A0A518BIQ3_9BACT|nr:Putative ketoacyl reductase [Planctomycetes bacterium Pla133]QDV01172.1 Putative ketoacyl reductase [Planctomycetes bacterium Pla86]